MLKGVETTKWEIVPKWSVEVEVLKEINATSNVWTQNKMSVEVVSCKHWKQLE